MSRSQQRLWAFTSARLSRLWSSVKSLGRTEIDDEAERAEGQVAEAEDLALSAAGLRGGIAKIAQLRAYLDIMAVRMGRRLQFDIQLPEALADRLVPPMLLQPLVENAIRHGLEPKVGGGRIDIGASATPHGLVVTVADTGMGLRTDRPASDGSHYGLTHVRERLRTLYGDAARLELQPNDPQGTIAIVTLP
jgi:signal transduction histidine kinase